VIFKFVLPRTALAADCETQVFRQNIYFTIYQHIILCLPDSVYNFTDFLKDLWFPDHFESLSAMGFSPPVFTAAD
jgi:hypothetical protein